MKEVSKVVGIAVSRVSQIHAAAMVKLRGSLNHLRERSKVPVPAQAQVHPMQAAYREVDNRQYGRRL